jgi:hypothetical protein
VIIARARRTFLSIPAGPFSLGAACHHIPPWRGIQSFSRFGLVRMPVFKDVRRVMFIPLPAHKIRSRRGMKGSFEDVE